MMDEWKCTLHVEPAGKGRPRFGGGRTYTPQKTRLKQEEIRYWLLQKGAPKFDGPIAFTVIATFLKPKSAPKKRVFHQSRPDMSNVLRLVEDAATGILFDDDRQIVWTQGIKRYGERDSIEIRVSRVEDVEALKAI